MQALQDVLIAVEDYTQEKRTAKRQSLLRTLFQSITHYATGEAGWELVSAHRDTLVSVCNHSLRPEQSAAEQYAACRVWQVASIVLGAQEDQWVETILESPLRRIVKSQHRVLPVRAAALRTLVVAATICAAQDSLVTESLQDLCELVAAPESNNHATLRAAALDGWVLLASLQEDIYVAGQDNVQMGRGLAIIELLRECLFDVSSTELRSAAGQCLALIHEARLRLGVDAVQNSKDEHAAIAINSTARRYQQGSWEGTSWEEIMDEVRQRVAELSVESGHHLSKKVKKEQRATFREYMATIVDDEAPELEIHFRNNAALTLQTWKEIVQLNMIRNCLQSGFQVQMLTNATLQSMFGTEGQALNANSGSMSQLEKRLVLSKTSELAKLADQGRRGRRDKRENVKNHFLTADGDDL